MSKPTRQRSLAGFDDDVHAPPGELRTSGSAAARSEQAVAGDGKQSPEKESSTPPVPAESGVAEAEAAASGTVMDAAAVPPNSEAGDAASVEQIAGEPNSGEENFGERSVGERSFCGTTPRSAAETAGLPEDLKGKTVYVVDSHSLIYQVFHALPEMSSPTGQPVGAVHGFIRDILQILESKQPDFLFCAFDPPGATFRSEMYEQYKESREAMPDDLRPQIASIRRMLGAMGVPILQCDNYEADDVLATVARITSQQGGTCFLVTGDKDCRQLISDRVFVYNIRKDEFFDAVALEKTWGIRPEQVVDFQALVGDSIDNVPGVPLIGPKIACQLLNQYGTLERVLDNAEQVAGKKRRENLLTYREQALLSRELVRLKDDVPIDIDWPAGRVGGVERDEVLELCREFGFRNLTERLGELTTAEAPATWQATYHIVASETELAALVERMRQQERISLDLETTSLLPRWAEVVGYVVAWQAGEAYYIPVRAPAGEACLDPQTALQYLREVLLDPNIQKVGQNLKYDMVVLRSLGVELAGVAFDTMMADYLLDPGERNHSLDDLARRYLNHTTIKIKDLIGSGKKQKRLDEVPVAQVAEYAGEDADVALRLTDILESRLAAQGLSDLFHSVEIPLLQVLTQLEYQGISVDLARLAELSEKFGARIEALEAEIHELAGARFNIGSPTQLAKVLFEQLGLPVVKKTKTGASTDVEVLQQLAKLHPLPAKVIDYRQYAKLKSGYVDALPALVHPITKRVHTSFKQDVAATGRLSSQDPNLQNIPIRSEAGREIRSAFRPGPAGWRLLAADYSQIELRVLAHFSGDKTLQTAFHEDRDVHRLVASEVYQVPLDEVSDEMRRSAKAINFGVIYGQSPFGLAKSLDIDKQDAADFIDAYFDRYVGVTEFIEKILAECRDNGYVSTILGRRRAVRGVRDPSLRRDSRHRSLPERIAINTVIQGSAADLIKLAMLRVHGRLQRERLQARMLLQIHDELVFEVPSNELDQLATLATEEMSSVGPLAVPLKVDVKTGANWAECEPWG